MTSDIENHLFILYPVKFYFYINFSNMVEFALKNQVLVRPKTQQLLHGLFIKKEDKALLIKFFSYSSMQENFLQAVWSPPTGH